MQFVIINENRYLLTKNINTTRRYISCFAVFVVIKMTTDQMKNAQRACAYVLYLIGMDGAYFHNPLKYS